MEQERLVVALEARIRDFEKNMAKAGVTAGRSFDQIERRAKQSGDRLEKTMAAASARIGSTFKNFGAGLFAGIAAGGIAGIVTQIGSVAKGIASVGDEAKRAGVSTRAFQEWKFVAEQNRIGIDAMVDGLKELNLRADEFVVTGKGSAAEAFQRLGYSAADLKAKLKDPSALLLEIIGRLGQMDRAAQIRIADELFGGSAGERFVELLDQGEASIRATIDQAHDLGIVMDDELIAKAAELDKRFNAVANTVGTALKSAIVSAADSLAGFIDAFRSFENQRYSTLTSRSTDIDRERLELENKLLEAKGNPNPRNRSRAMNQFQLQLDQLNAESAEIEAELAKRTPPMARTTDRTWTPPVAPPGGFGSAPARAPSRGASATAAERERQAVSDLIAELEEELRLIGATDVERRASEASRRAGTAATTEQRAQIIALNEAIHSEGAALDANRDRMQALADGAKDFISGFRNDIMSGVPPLQALGNAIGRVADRIFDDLLKAMFTVNEAGSGGGLAGGIFGFLSTLLGFSGGGLVKADAWQGLRLARGGHVRGPGTGTSDSIPARLSDGEFVVNAAATRKHRALLEAVNDNRVASFAGGGLVGRDDGRVFDSKDNGPQFAINAPITVQGSAGTPEQNDDLAKKMARQMEATMRGVVADELRKAQRPGNMANSRSQGR